MKSLALFLLIALLFIGCEEKKLEPVAVGEMAEYRDPGYGFKISYPKEWRQLGNTGRAVFAKSQEVVEKFQNSASGEEGAMVSAEVMRYDGKKADELIAAAKEELKQAATLTPDEQVTIGGKPATKIPYSIPVTKKKSIMGYEIFIPGDTALYKIDVVGYGDQFTAHAAVFDAMLKSYELPVIVLKKPDTWSASPNLDTYNCDFFTIQYPDNLEFVDAKKGKFDLAVERRADRFDCTIHIDVFGAQKLTLEKVWEQNKSRYKAKGTGQATIDGNSAQWVQYTGSAANKVDSKAYFIVKNDKVIRITINYHVPQKDVYLPVFESSVNSLKLK
jgi:hypothetical protein